MLGVATGQGIDERSLEFSADVIRFARAICPDPSIRRLIEQTVAAVGSIAANRQEATSASSRREFTRYNEIALRSAKEAVVWLRLCEKTGVGDRDVCAALLDEGGQIVRILAAIVIKTKRRGSDL